MHSAHWHDPGALVDWPPRARARARAESREWARADQRAAEAEAAEEKVFFVCVKHRERGERAGEWEGGRRESAQLNS